MFCWTFVCIECYYFLNLVLLFYSICLSRVQCILKLPLKLHHCFTVVIWLSRFVYKVLHINLYITLPIASFDASTNMSKSLVQSGGCTTGAYDSMTLSAWYALSSCSVHWKGNLCTAACNGVAKSTKYWSIQLYH